MNWISVYLFYEEPLDHFLINAVHPFIKELEKDKLVLNYFFIRYWEKGPHIRLRIKVLPENDGKVRSRINNFYGYFFSKYPSVRNMDKYNGRILFENNSLQYVDYEPETERYGGATALALSEDQFTSSSGVVLSLLDENKSIEYESKITGAIQLHLGFSDKGRVNWKKEISRLFADITGRMMYHVLRNSETTEERSLITEKEKLLKSFETAREKQKAELSEFIRILSEAFEGKTEFENGWMNKYILESEETGNKFRSLRDDALLIPEWYKEDSRLLYIYESLVHMTNNRLGILNRDEAYLAYLINTTLTEIAE